MNCHLMVEGFECLLEFLLLPKEIQSHVKGQTKDSSKEKCLLHLKPIGIQLLDLCSSLVCTNTIFEGRWLMIDPLPLHSADLANSPSSPQLWSCGLSQSIPLKESQPQLFTCTTKVHPREVSSHQKAPDHWWPWVIFFCWRLSIKSVYSVLISVGSNALL